jgi:glycosyltransferase involved in cell wall biosynthesis
MTAVTSTLAAPLRLLWTLPYLPWPITSGGKARQFHLIRELAERGHRITLLVQSKTELDDDTRRVLAPLLEDLIVLPRRGLKHPLTLWHAATSSLPLLATVNGYAPALSARFAQLLRSQRWDAVQIEHSYGFAPFEAELRATGQPFIVTEHNVESELGAATYGKWPAALRGLATYDQFRARRWERRALSQASAVVAVTEADAHALGQISGRPTHVVSNGVDTRGFARVTPDPSSATALFVGNYEYAPNVDAVEWALTEVWPRAWALNPALRFRICGHGLPDAWRQRFPDPRIDWMGYVPDLTEVQARSAAFVAPLRFGGGSKLKVLEAMAASLPLISTPEGLSGLDAVDGVHARVARDAPAMAQAIVHTLTHPEDAAAMGQAARALVRERFDWSRAASQLEAVYASLTAAQPRAA